MMNERPIPYPHIKGAGVILPDCSEGVYTPFRLTNCEKRELVRKIAENGLKGIDEFLESDRKEGAVSEKLDELRKQMKEQLEKIKAKRRRSLDDQIRNLMNKGGIATRESSDGLLRESGFRRFSSEEIRGEILASELIGALEGRVQIPDYIEKIGLIRRIWRAIKRFFVRIMSGILRLIRCIKNRFKKDADRDENIRSRRKKKGALILPFPSLQKDLSDWEKRMDRQLDDDDNLQKAVDQRISDKFGFTSGWIQLKRSSDPEWYKEEARKILHEEVKDAVKEKESDLEKKRVDLRSDERQRIEDERSRRQEIMRLEKAFEKEAADEERSLKERTKEEMKKELVSTLANMGYLKRVLFKDDIDDETREWEITEALVEKFSELIYAEVMEGRRGIKDRRGRQASDAGVYEKARLRTINEESRMDILQTIVNARLNHPDDRHIDHHDMTVYREVTTSEMHGVIIMDISGSMEENMRIEAAKRSVLALTQAIKRDNPRNRVDLISLSTRAVPLSLRDVMTIEPRGFTNHQEAIGLARAIFDRSRADKFLLFLITDGLPEAYTNEKGEAVAGDLDRSMELALKEASGLIRYPDLVFNIFLLEPEDETFVSSARKIAKEGSGRVIVADPKQLASRVLGTYDDGTSILGGV